MHDMMYIPIEVWISYWTAKNYLYGEYSEFLIPSNHANIMSDMSTILIMFFVFSAINSCTSIICDRTSFNPFLNVWKLKYLVFEVVQGRKFFFQVITKHACQSHQHVCDHNICPG